jgi:predicted aspartyl protease
MRTSRWAAITVALALPAPAAFAAAPDPCPIERQGELPLIGPASSMLVAARINGSPVTLIADTGAPWTAITPETVERLDLPRDSRHGGLHRGVEGFGNNINAVVGKFEIGGMVLEGRSVSVAPLSIRASISPPLAGLLGADFLYRFDLDINLQRRTLTLYRNDGCRVGVPTWRPAAAIPLVKSATNRLNLAASVNGHPFRAILDTGASISLITRPNALRAGVTTAQLERDLPLPSGGVGTKEFITQRHVFDEVQIGPERLRNVALAVGGRTLGGGDLLLGLDYFGTRRVWVSYRLRQMFIAPATLPDEGAPQPAR